jgi:hypothetical protein
MEVGLFPCKADFTSCDLFEGDLWRRRDIETELLHQDIV